MKKVIIFTLVAILSIVQLVAIPTDDSIKTAASNLGVPFDALQSFVSSYYPIEDTPDVIEVTPEQYNADYKNAFLGEQKYMGKTVRMKIIVSAIGSIDAWGSNYEIDTSRPMVWFALQKTEDHKLATITKGTEILIEGESLSDIWIIKSKILQIYP